MKRLRPAFFAILLPLLAASASAQEARPAAMIVFDSSNSMWTQVERINKVQILRENLAATFQRSAASVDFGLVTYGHKETNSCSQAQLLKPPGAHDPAELAQAVSAVNPAKGATPLAGALEQAATAPGFNGRGDIILITDGLDNCRRDACRAARELHADYDKLRIHVIGFGLSAKRELKDLNCVADITAGSFYLASTREEFESALQAVVAIASTPRDLEAPTLSGLVPGGSAGDVTGALDDEPRGEQQPPVSTLAQGVDQSLPAAVATAPAEAMRQIQDQVQQEELAGSGSIRLGATLTGESALLTSGLVWRVFSSKPDSNGTYKVVARSEDGNPVFELPAGTYVVHLAYGRANATRDVAITATRTQDEIINLDAGGLRLHAVLPGGKPIAENLVTYSIYAPEQDQSGERKLIMPQAEPNKIIRLNAGNYHIVSQYGDANAVVRANVAVQAGRLSEATVNHAASKITLKLVNELGGEALANTSWTILSPDGNVVAESVGAFPSHILAAGEYNVLARHEGKGYNRAFTVQAGFDEEVEVLASE